MPGKNGLSARILAWVRDNPGRRGREMGAALGFNHSGGLLSYMRANGLIFGAGPCHWTCYYLTAEEAAANHERITQEASVAVMHNRKQYSKDRNVRRTANRRAGAPARQAAIQARAAEKAEQQLRLRADKRQAEALARQAAIQSRAASKAQQAAVIARTKAALGKHTNVVIPADVRITIAATPPPRFAPGPGWVGAISRDYIARRQGAAA